MVCEDDATTWTILEGHNTWLEQSTGILNDLLANCAEDMLSLPCKNRKRRQTYQKHTPHKQRRAVILKKDEPRDDEDDDAAIECSTTDEDAYKNEFSSDTEFEKAEHEALMRIQNRKTHSQDFAKTTDSIVSIELENIAESLLECEQYELETTGKSSLTLKKISHQIRELKHVLFVECHVIIPPHLLRNFADRVFVGKRKHLRNSFLFHFTHNS